MNVPDLSQLGKSDPDDRYHDLGQPLPSEENKMKIIMAEVHRKFFGKPMTEENQLAMGNEIVDRFANELRMRVILTWAGVQPDMSDPNSQDLYYLPQIDVLGRIEAVATDHDLVKSEIQSGEADGQQYWVKEDGTRTSEPSSKSFY